MRAYPIDVFLYNRETRTFRSEKDAMQFSVDSELAVIGKQDVIEFALKRVVAENGSVKEWHFRSKIRDFSLVIEHAKFDPDVFKKPVECYVHPYQTSLGGWACFEIIMEKPPWHGMDDLWDSQWENHGS